MATTAEKIEKLQQDVLIMRDDLEQFDARLQEIAFTADEQDRKDAARFRGLQRMCRFHTTTWSKLEHTPVERWREVIDEAMEQE